jgi:hypothetical protein
LDLQQTDIAKSNESDGLEDYWKDFALAVESTKVRVSTAEFDLYCSNQLKIFNYFPVDC